MRKFMRAVVFSACAMLSFTALAQTESGPSEVEKLQSDIRAETATIKTRADLIRELADKNRSHPLRKLSDDARIRLLDTLIVNENGEISSFFITDIQSELTPSEAYKVFALFGAPELAGIVNNKQIKSTLDKKIVELGKKDVHPMPGGTIPYQYCNGGYCTSNEHLSCVSGHCNPPK